MKLSLILTIIGAILLFLSFVTQLIISEQVVFILLFIAGLLLCVLCFIYFLAVDMRLFEKAFDTTKEILTGPSQNNVNTNQDRFCPKCGRSIPMDARICPYCAKIFNGKK